MGACRTYRHAVSDSCTVQVCEQRNPRRVPETGENAQMSQRKQNITATCEFMPMQADLSCAMQNTDESAGGDQARVADQLIQQSTFALK